MVLIVKGRRRIYIFIGIIFDIIGIFCLYISPNVWVFIGGYVLTATSVTLAAAPYAGLVSDVVPPKFINSTSGVIG